MKTVVIIGGGLGGLFAGALLAKEGLRVTLIEKNVIVGGGLQSFKRFGEVFDTGMHVLGGMRKGGSVYRLCQYLGLSDKIRIKDVDAHCASRLYFAEDGHYYDIAEGKAGFVNSLAALFPAERENLQAYVDAIYALSEELDLFYLRPSSGNLFAHSDDFMMPADQFIAKYITDSRLRSIVAYMNPSYAGVRNVTPAYVHAVISVLHINGQSRFVGGSHLFAEALCDCITAHGGEVLKGNGVKKINTAEGKVTSVVTQDGTTLTADYYISAIHPCEMLKLLDNEKVLPKPYRTRLGDIPSTYSAFILNIKLKPHSFKYLNHTAYYMSRYDKIWSFADDDDCWPLGFLYMTPPEEAQGEYSTKLTVVAPMTWSHVRKWQDSTIGHRPMGYEAWKEDCANAIINRMEKLYPGFRGIIENVNTASPLTIRDYYGSKEGCMCGYSKDSHNPVLSVVPVVTKLPNLFLTGQCNNLHGFCGVPLTAVSTCEAILGMNHILNKLQHLQP
ncbi:MAG: NAD(P)/FAD-dependent oxidoreductase [Prevotellaceae bacterium]|nr:NAD(P)/FAD-dependent oxidoreductase [Prevotellaceae bacterium]MDY2750301.1 NAD(P)/FAD-dependent oxidoreductase [Prevotella sp.]